MSNTPSKMDTEYFKMLNLLLESGRKRQDRTGTGTLSIFGYQYRINIPKDGFPILTTKLIKFNSVFEELMWFISGSTNIKDLNGVKIWNEWADENGSIGPSYGHQLTNWGGVHNEPGTGVNQLERLIDQLINNPFSRRHIISFWNVSDLPDEKVSPQENVKNGKMALAPCHAFYTFSVRDELDGKRYLDCMLTQRSADVFLGLPFNIASVATLLHVIGMITGYVPGEVIHSIGDLHLYNNHIEQAKLQLSRTPRSAPILVLKAEPNPKLNNDIILDWELVGYDPHPFIPAKVAV